MDLIPALEGGTTIIGPSRMPAVTIAALNDTAAHYGCADFSPPWTGYIDVEDDDVVGSCAFVAAPAHGEVGTAYYTFPENEGRGVATWMAMRQIKIAASLDLSVIVRAHALPEENASTAILRKLGFTLSGTVFHSEDGEVRVWRYQRSRV